MPLLQGTDLFLNDNSKNKQFTYFYFGIVALICEGRMTLHVLYYFHYVVYARLATDA